MFCSVCLNNPRVLNQYKQYKKKVREYQKKFPEIPHDPFDYVSFQKNSQIEAAQNYFPIFPKRCWISKRYLKQQFPDQFELFAADKNRKGVMVPQIMCKKHQSDSKIIILTPCMHIVCQSCMFQKFRKSIEKKYADKNSLVCDVCQSYITIKDIKIILQKDPRLQRYLGPDNQYCDFTFRDECPKCNKTILYDNNNTNQKCLGGCNFQFCKDCLLTTHQGKTCFQAVQQFVKKQRKSKIENNKVSDQSKEDFYNKSKNFGVCPKCRIPSRKMNGYQSQFARCRWCKLIFCSHHQQEYDSKHPCCGETNLIFLKVKNLAIKG